MNQLRGLMSIRLGLTLGCLGGLLTITAAAQNRDNPSSEDAPNDRHEVKFRHDLLTVVETKSSFETKVVKGVPYAATVETETVQTFADGNSIVSKNTSRVYRDGEGRTRREREVGSKGQKIVKEIFISDPANGVNFILDEVGRKAFRMTITLRELGLEKKRIPGPVKPADLPKARSAERSINPAEPQQKNGAAELSEKLSGKEAAVTEQLGRRFIEGTDCEGKRTTFTIPAGAIGNMLPMKIVSEQWYSSDLQVLVLSIHQDPRIGKTTYRLTDIKRYQPDKSLFEVPADYTIIDKPGTNNSKKTGRDSSQPGNPPK